MSLVPSPHSLERSAPVAPLPKSASLKDWSIETAPMVETSQERVHLAAHREEPLQAWYHILSDLQGKRSEHWDAHFSRMLGNRDEDHPVAELIGWGFQKGFPFYLTKFSNGEFLTQWKPRRQSRSATSVRMQLMLQAIQLAQSLMQPGEVHLELRASMVTVHATEAPSCPYRLRTNCLLPSGKLEAGNSRLANDLMQETSHILDLLLAGMPWPVELTRAYQQTAETPRVRLSNCEKILSGMIAGDIESGGLQGRAKHRKKSFLVQPRFLGISAAVLCAFGGIMAYSSYDGERGVTRDLDTSASPQVAPAAPQPLLQAATAKIVESVPQSTSVQDQTDTVKKAVNVGPAAIAIHLKNLRSAIATGDPPSIFETAKVLLQASPSNAEADAAIKQLFHNELHRQMEDADVPKLTAADGWAAWAELGYQEAKILAAVESWSASPADSFQELDEIARQGSTEAMVLLGQCLSANATTQTDLLRGYEYYKMAAEAGERSGKCLQGLGLKQGRGVQQDPVAAVKLLQEAAKAGDARAMDSLAESLSKGEGVARNIAEAARWMNAAIVAGNNHSLANLAVLYLNGDGVKKDPLRAIALLKRGEELEQPRCLLLLGQCAENGRGMKEDVKAARNYYATAARLGDPDAKEWLQAHPISSGSKSRNNHN